MDPPKNRINKLLSRVWVNIYGVWIANRMYWSLKHIATINNYESLTELRTPKETVTTAHIVFWVFTSRYLIAASNGGRFPSSEFPNSPPPQEPASHFLQLKNKSYVMADGQSASLSWCKAFIWGHDQIFSTVRELRALLTRCALSDEKTALLFTTDSILVSAVFLWTDSRGTHGHISLSQIRNSPNVEGQVPIFVSTKNRVAQLCP